MAADKLPPREPFPARREPPTGESDGYGKGRYGEARYGGFGSAFGVGFNESVVGTNSPNLTDQSEGLVSKPTGGSTSLMPGADSLTFDGDPPTFDIRGEAEVDFASAKRNTQATLSVTVHDELAPRDEIDATVIPGIWNQTGLDIDAAIEAAERELHAMLLLSSAVTAFRTNNPNAHNGPPEIIDAPVIDVTSLQAALTAIRVLKKLRAEPSAPDYDFLELVWRTLLVAVEAMSKFAAWAALLGAKKFGHYLNNVLDNMTKSWGTEVGKTLGSPTGIVVLSTLVLGIAYGPKSSLTLVVEIVKAALSAHGAAGH